MICRCFGQTLDLAALRRRLGETAHLMVGQPDYATYVAHVSATHPERAIMTRDEFFREREAARFGTRGNLRCC